MQCVEDLTVCPLPCLARAGTHSLLLPLQSTVLGLGEAPLASLLYVSLRVWPFLLRFAPLRDHMLPGVGFFILYFFFNYR
jgi:hypothetical protein